MMSHRGLIKDRPLKKQHVLVLIFVLCFVGSSISQEQTLCLLEPPYHRLEFPIGGFQWIDEDLAVDSCLTATDSVWDVQTGKSHTLFVAADGPWGSGRFWTVTVGIAASGENGPQRGFCLLASTVGWRTLRSFSELPLPWIGDQDSDGQPELIVWDSFPLHDQASMAEFGLMGWVYELDHEGVLNLSLLLSRERANTIVSAYRTPVDGSDERHQKVRNQCAEHLEVFASGKCKLREP